MNRELTACAAVLAAVALTGCASFNKAKDAASALAKSPLGTAAGAADPRIAAALAVINGQAQPDPFAGATVTYGPWRDAKGVEVTLPISRTAVKTTTETLGTAAPSAGPASPAAAPIAAGPTNPQAAAAAPVAGQPAATVAGKIDQIANTPVGGGK